MTANLLEKAVDLNSILRDDQKSFKENIVMKKVVVVDVDGTVADPKHRLHFVRPIVDPVTGIKPKKNWRAFAAGIKDDEPIWSIINVVRTLWRAGSTIIISTGRADDSRDATAEWLTRYGIVFEKMYMRRAGDYRDDGIVKVELLAAMRADGYDPEVWFDDRQRVCDALRGVGIKVLQCAPGDF